MILIPLDLTEKNGEKILNYYFTPESIKNDLPLKKRGAQALSDGGRSGEINGGGIGREIGDGEKG